MIDIDHTKHSIALLAFAALAQLTLASSESIFIQSAPNFVAEGATNIFSFNLTEAVDCFGNIDADAPIDEIEISFIESNGSFSRQLNYSFSQGLHYVFIRCLNENSNFSDPAFYTSFIVVPHDQLPEKVDERLQAPPAQGPQDEIPPTLSNPGGNQPSFYSNPVSSGQANEQNSSVESQPRELTKTNQSAGKTQLAQNNSSSKKIRDASGADSISTLASGATGFAVASSSSVIALLIAVLAAIGLYAFWKKSFLPKK